MIEVGHKVRVVSMGGNRIKPEYVHCEGYVIQRTEAGIMVDLDGELAVFHPDNLLRLTLTPLQELEGKYEQWEKRLTHESTDDKTRKFILAKMKKITSDYNAEEERLLREKANDGANTSRA